MQEYIHFMYINKYIRDKWLYMDDWPFSRNWNRCSFFNENVYSNLYHGIPFYLELDNKFSR